MSIPTQSILRTSDPSFSFTSQHKLTHLFIYSLIRHNSNTPSSEETTASSCRDSRSTGTKTQHKLLIPVGEKAPNIMTPQPLRDTSCSCHSFSSSGDVRAHPSSHPCWNKSSDKAQGWQLYLVLLNALQDGDFSPARLLFINCRSPIQNMSNPPCLQTGSVLLPPSHLKRLWALEGISGVFAVSSNQNHQGVTEPLNFSVNVTFRMFWVF